MGETDRETIRRQADEAERKLAQGRGTTDDKVVCLADAGFQMLDRIEALEAEVKELRRLTGPLRLGGGWADA